MQAGIRTVTCMCDYRRSLDWCLDLLTTYKHDTLSTSNYSATAISTIQKSPQQTLSLFPAWCAFTSRSLAMASNSGDSSASRAQVLSSQPPLQNSTTLTTKSKSKSHCDWRSVSLSVLVSSPRPDVSSCLKVTVLSMWGALSDERSGLSFVSDSR
jgi:hypothetical protein